MNLLVIDCNERPLMKEIGDENMEDEKRRWKNVMSRSKGKENKVQVEMCRFY